MATSTFTTASHTDRSHADQIGTDHAVRSTPTTRPALWRAGVVSSIVAAAATTAVAAIARAADVPLAVDGESIPLLGFAQLWDFVYLVGFFAICLWIAMRQMERKLIK